MTSYALLLISAFALLGGLLGAFVVLPLANWLLRRSYRRSCKWFSDMASEYERFMQSRSGVKLSEGNTSAACVSTGAVSMWLADVKRAISAGTISQEQAARLKGVGIECNASANLLTEREQLKAYISPATVPKRIALALGLGVVCALPLTFGLSVQLVLLLVPCWFSLALSVVCDVRARIIPLECCVTLGAFGVLFQLLAVGGRGLVVGGIAAVVIVVVCSLANKLFARRSSPVGFGDIRLMVALALACGNGVLPGAFACYIAAAIFSAVGVASRKLKLSDGVPMAPFLAIWFLVGICFTR